MVMIGVLAVQGGFAAHQRMLHSLGHSVRLVKKLEDFQGLDGLVLPGGESSTQIHLLNRLGMWDALRSFVGCGKPVLGTCAGAILLAKHVLQPQQSSLQAVSIEVARNGWGRQIASFEARSEQKQLPLLFIRAPRFIGCTEHVSIHDTFDGEPIWVSEGACHAVAFHPELTSSSVVHEAIFG